MENCKIESYSSLNGFSVQSHSSDNEQNGALSDKSFTDDARSVEELEPEMVTLQREFRKYYQKKLAGIDSCDDVSVMESGKLQILLKYVEQLEEQNDFLMETMVELEKEAQERVHQMERRLKSSAKSTMESVINLHQWEQEMRRLVNERLQMETSFLNMQRQVNSTLVENNFLRDQSFNLNHDIQALLHIIQHARSTGHWEMDCVTFCEVTPEQVFGPVQSVEPLCSSRSGSPTLLLGSKNTADYDQRQKHDSFEKLSQTGSSIQSLHLHSLMLDKERRCQCSSDKSAGEKCLSQRNEPTNDTMCRMMIPDSKSIFRSISLPALRNSNCRPYLKETLSNSKSCSFISKKSKNIDVSEFHESERLKPMLLELPDSPRNHSCQSLCRSSYGSVFRRAYSEPHLFMFGDCIYVYRPCETMHRVSSLSLKCGDSGLQPCRSIDLKLPSESEDCERAWGLHTRDYPTSFGSSIPCSIDRLSRESCSTSHSKDIRNFMGRGNRIVGHQAHVRPSFKNSKCQTDKSFAVRNVDVSCDEMSVISCCVQTEDIKSFTIGLQADFSDQESMSLRRVLSEDTIEGMTVNDVNKSMQLLKDSLLKAEDKVSAQIILIQELQGHLNNVSKNVELRDSALANIEKKLNSSRSECKGLKDEISSLQNRIDELTKAMEDLKTVNDNLTLEVENEKKKVEELLSQEKVLQNQKRALMTQLDTQGDELERQTNELIVTQKKLENCTVQMEQQNQIIMSLQEALVQSKRAFDEIQRTTNNHSLPKKDLQSRSLHSSRSVIVDL